MKTDAELARIHARARHDWDHAQCHYCDNAIHDGNTCIECWRDIQERNRDRDKDWWS